MLNTARIARGASSAWAACLDVLFPRTCLRCGRLVIAHGGGFMCPDCRAQVSWVREPCCGICGVPFFGLLVSERTCPACQQQRPVFARARSLFLYRDAGARLVHVLKYEQGVWLRDEIARQLATDTRWRGYFAGAALVPVPLHPRKLRARGYNQAEVIAGAVRRAFPEVAVRPCLRRTRMTPSQTFLSREQRLANMAGAFAFDGQLPPGTRLVLVDDVLTTGATLNAAALALKRAGAGEVDAFTLAHG